jgi:GT2 family glycosyltransferase
VTAPTLSVIIASLSGPQYLAQCLAALHNQQGDILAEIIVAGCLGTTFTQQITAQFPTVRLLSFDPPQSVAQLRAAAINAAQGQLIAITEDHCLPASDWFQSLLAAHGRHENLAIGGAVDNAATERPVDWAVFLCEYSRFISPAPAGPVNDLPGPNVSYKRAAFAAVANPFPDGYRETFFHQQLQNAGHVLWSDPAVCVHHKKHFTLGEFISERFHYGRWFAGTRSQAAGPARRLFYLTFSPLLPPLLLARIAGRTRKNPLYFTAYLKTLPLLLLFSLAWAAGEFTGGALGPGASELHLS